MAGAVDERVAPLTVARSGSVHELPDERGISDSCGDRREKDRGGTDGRAVRIRTRGGRTAGARPDVGAVGVRTDRRIGLSESSLQRIETVRRRRSGANCCGLRGVFAHHFHVHSRTVRLLPCRALRRHEGTGCNEKGQNLKYLGSFHYQSSWEIQNSRIVWRGVSIVGSASRTGEFSTNGRKSTTRGWRTPTMAKTNELNLARE